MRTEVVDPRKILKFGDISYNKTETEAGVFFQLYSPNKDFSANNYNKTMFENGDVLVTVQSHFTVDYDDGEICYNLTKSELIFVPFTQEIYIVRVCGDEPVKFVRV